MLGAFILKRVYRHQHPRYLEITLLLVLVTAACVIRCDAQSEVDQDLDQQSYIDYPHHPIDGDNAGEGTSQRSWWWPYVAQWPLANGENSLETENNDFASQATNGWDARLQRMPGADPFPSIEDFESLDIPADTRPERPPPPAVDPFADDSSEYTERIVPDWCKAPPAHRSRAIESVIQIDKALALGIRLFQILFLSGFRSPANAEGYEGFAYRKAQRASDFQSPGLFYFEDFSVESLDVPQIRRDGSAEPGLVQVSPDNIVSIHLRNASMTLQGRAVVIYGWKSVWLNVTLRNVDIDMRVRLKIEKRMVRADLQYFTESELNESAAEWHRPYFLQGEKIHNIVSQDKHARFRAHFTLNNSNAHNIVNLFAGKVLDPFAKFISMFQSFLNQRIFPSVAIAMRISTATLTDSLFLEPLRSNLWKIVTELTHQEYDSESAVSSTMNDEMVPPAGQWFCYDAKTSLVNREAARPFVSSYDGEAAIGALSTFAISLHPENVEKRKQRHAALLVRFGTQSICSRDPFSLGCSNVGLDLRNEGRDNNNNDNGDGNENDNEDATFFAPRGNTPHAVLYNSDRGIYGRAARTAQKWIHRRQGARIVPVFATLADLQSAMDREDTAELPRETYTNLFRPMVHNGNGDDNNQEAVENEEEDEEDEDDNTNTLHRRALSSSNKVVHENEYTDHKSMKEKHIQIGGSNLEEDDDDDDARSVSAVENTDALVIHTRERFPESSSTLPLLDIHVHPSVLSIAVQAAMEGLNSLPSNFLSRFQFAQRKSQGGLTVSVTEAQVRKIYSKPGERYESRVFAGDSNDALVVSVRNLNVEIAMDLQISAPEHARQPLSYQYHMQSSSKVSYILFGFRTSIKVRFVAPLKIVVDEVLVDYDYMGSSPMSDSPFVVRLLNTFKISLDAWLRHQLCSHPDETREAQNPLVLMSIPAHIATAARQIAGAQTVAVLATIQNTINEGALGDMMRNSRAPMQLHLWPELAFENGRLRIRAWAKLKDISSSSASASADDAETEADLQEVRSAVEGETNRAVVAQTLAAASALTDTLIAGE